jgi:hypothetical protein
MATKTTNQSFLGGDQSPEKIRSEFIDKPLEAAKQAVLGSGLELFNLMSALPDAFIASQRRELERVKASGKDNDDRVVLLEASIAQATELRTTVQLGETRVGRALSSVGDSEIAFHGFVSNTEFEPVGGLTVRLSGREGEGGKRGLTATTDDDGYFRIPLGSKRDSGKEWRTRVGQINFAEKINILSEQQAAAADASSANDTSAATKARAQVEILDGNKSVYQDPVGVPIDEGSVYREYAVAVEKGTAAADYGESESAGTKKEEIDVSQAPSKKRATKKASTTKRSTKK